MSLQKEWYLIPEEKLNNLIRTTPQRFKLCINENGKSIGHKLYTLKKKENEDFQYIFSQNDNMNDQESPILKIPIQNIDFTFCEQIAQKLIQNDQIPYILKIDNDNYLLPQYKETIKHHISIPSIMKKLKNSEYLSPSDFADDIDLMWANIETFFGIDSDIGYQCKIFQNDIKQAWHMSSLLE